MKQLIAVATLGLVVSAGCSVLKTQSPKPYPSSPACRQSRGPVVIDIAGAIIGAPVAAVVVWAYADGNGYDRSTQNIMVGATGSAWFLAAVGSAVLGMIRTSRCRDAYASVPPPEP